MEDILLKPDLDNLDFKNLGLLQEVNRLFFHPRGLALYLGFNINYEEGNLVPTGNCWILNERDQNGIGFDPDYIKENKESFRIKADFVESLIIAPVQEIPE